ncbi:hypothetical protein P3T76_013337 [Phytophthora citrophthora]|uniref:Uncharacterized protein n=1 Tax=Phytophthora citrophthora TaxID=4793 RepID=A0AAD9LC33_9STRA|nr:hypothetical protein P3T76_013337 [Phytophthora citrophthora]
MRQTDLELGAGTPEPRIRTGTRERTHTGRALVELEVYAGLELELEQELEDELLVEPELERRLRPERRERRKGCRCCQDDCQLLFAPEAETHSVARRQPHAPV